MNAKKIQIGNVYSAKVDGTYLPVQITASLGHGRYKGTNMRTDAHVKPSEATVKICTGDIKGAGQTIEDWKAHQTAKDETAATVAAVEKGNLADGITVPAGKKRQPKADKAAKERKPSGLDAAARVLREAGTPLHCGEMVKTMLEKGYWSTGGKTPAATIYAAIITEIAKKGDQSRFRKTDRGTFELTK
jgi:hypothetical protein